MQTLDPAAFSRLQEDLGGGREVMSELVETFLVEGDRLVAGMRASLATGDRRELNRAVHSLKSTSATFGGTALSKLCRSLEEDTGGTIPSDAAARIGAIEQEWARVAADLRAWLASG